MRKKITKKFLLVFIILGTIGITLRSVRNRWLEVPTQFFDLVNHEFIVYIEHLCAGIGVPAGIAMLFLTITSADKRKHVNKIWQLKINQFFEGVWFYWFVVICSALGYIFHIFEHEMRQTTQSGYWGVPYLHINVSQVLVGIFGVLLFLVYAFKLAKFKFGYNNSSKAE